jgi:hypothetical protein
MSYVLERKAKDLSGVLPSAERSLTVKTSAGTIYIKVTDTHMSTPAHSWSWRAEIGIFGPEDK